MMTGFVSSRRPLVRVPVGPGPEGIRALLPHVAAALDGTGPAIAPTPVAGPAVSADYVGSVLRAVRADDPAAPLESDDVALVMATSGSTGSPRGVLLAAECLAPGTTAANGPSPADVQWVLALPATSMGGMNVVVRALATGRAPVCVPSIGGAGPFRPEQFREAVLAALADCDDVRVSIVPAQAARLLDDPAGIEALQACSLILVGGAASRPATLARAAGLGIALTTTYGATETAGGCAFNGRAIPGAAITAPDGRIRVCGTVVARGYRLDPVATAEAFADGCYLSADLGTIDADGLVAVSGRADDVIIVNGVNVSPLAVEDELARVPGVAAAAVVTVHGSAEPRLVAFVEAAPAGGLADQCMARVRDALGRPAVPVVSVLERLPYLPHGKVDRRALEALARDLVAPKES